VNIGVSQAYPVVGVKGSCHVETVSHFNLHLQIRAREETIC